MSLTVPAFPVVRCQIDTATTGSIIMNNAPQPLVATSIQTLRVGVIAFTASIARQMNRPVELNILEPGRDPFRIAVHPDGFTQTISPDRTVPEIPAGDARPIAHAPCRNCGRMVTPTYTYCIHCRTRNPLSVLIGEDA
ncbi:hypothetical protein ACFVUP_37580 [Streptomyces bacillaris]|uniref:hypothetical protein n=1 Tax=Streptomyces bacillaris TaxID=68179 RepID=UPI0036DF66B4